MNSTTCPKCKGDNISTLTPAERKEKKVVGSLLGHFKCSDCGEIWEKPAPKWLWGMGWLLGVALIAPLPITIVMTVASRKARQPYLPGNAGEDASALYGTVTLAFFGFLILKALFKQYRAEKARKR